MKRQGTLTRDLFVMYAREDKAFVDEMYKHLSILERNNLCSIWYDHYLFPGDEWENEINKQIRRADIVLILLSSNFISSNYSYTNEMELALEQQKKSNLVIIPFLTTACFWQETPLKKFQILPSTLKPLSQSENKNIEYKELTKVLKKRLNKITFEEYIVLGEEEFIHNDWYESEFYFSKAKDIHIKGYNPTLIELEKKIQACKDELEYLMYLKRGNNYFKDKDFLNAKDSYSVARKLKPSFEIDNKIGECRSRIKTYRKDIASIDYIRLLIVGMCIVISLISLFRSDSIILDKGMNTEYKIFEKNGKNGVLIVNSDSLIIPPIYYEIVIYQKNIFIVRSENGWGVINRQGKLVINTLFEDKDQLSRIMDCYFEK